MLVCLRLTSLTGHALHCLERGEKLKLALGISKRVELAWGLRASLYLLMEGKAML